MYGRLAIGQPVSADSIRSLSTAEQAEWATFNAAMLAFAAGTGPEPDLTPAVHRLNYLNTLWIQCTHNPDPVRCAALTAEAEFRDAFPNDLAWAHDAQAAVTLGELYENPAVAAAASAWRLSESGKIAARPPGSGPEPAGIWRLVNGAPVRTEGNLIYRPSDIPQPGASGAVSAPWPAWVAPVAVAGVLALLWLSWRRS